MIANCQRRIALTTIAAMLACATSWRAVRGDTGNALNDYLDFNNNQVPTGWSLGFEAGSPGTNAQIANQQFQVGPVDTYALLTKNVALPVGTTAIQFSYTANAADDPSGMSSAIRLFDSSGDYFGINGPGHGGFGDPGVRMSIGYASGTGGPGASYYQGTYPEDWGTYNVSGTIQNGQVFLSATKAGASTPIFSGTISVPQLQLSQVSKIGISAFVTSGNPAWIDNVSIQSNPVIVAQSVNQTVPSTFVSHYTVVDNQLQVYDAGTQQFVTFSPTPGSQGYIDPTLPTVILTHGFSSNTSKTWADFAKQYSKADGHVNLVAWDWSTEADTDNLGYSASRTKNEGAGLGFALENVLGPNYSLPVHFIGHSLGTLVNSEAIDVLHAHDPNASIQDTLFDEASIADQFISNTSLAVNPIPQAGTTMRIDNYISSFGTLHTEATNVILTNDPTNPPKPTSLFYWRSFHGYPISWYAQSIGSNVGYGGAIDNGPFNLQDPNFQPDTYWQQTSGQSLTKTDLTPAANYLINRNNQQLTLLETANGQDAVSAFEDAGIGVVLGVTPAQLTGAVKYENNALVQMIASDPASSQGGPAISWTPQITLTKQPTVAVATAAITGATTNVADEPNVVALPSSSSSVWVPLAIPAHAQYLSLNFTFSGLSPDDFLSIGIDDTPLFQMESQFIADSTQLNTGLLNISAWSGKDVELFLGLIASDDNSGGNIVISDVQLESLPIPEPSTLLLTGAGLISLGSRRRRTR